MRCDLYFEQNMWEHNCDISHKHVFYAALLGLRANWRLAPVFIGVELKAIPIILPKIGSMMTGLQNKFLYALIKIVFRQPMLNDPQRKE